MKKIYTFSISNGCVSRERREDGGGSVVGLNMQRYFHSWGKSANQLVCIYFAKMDLNELNWEKSPKRYDKNIFFRGEMVWGGAAARGWKLQNIISTFCQYE